MRPVLEIERFESIEQFQIHYREWKKKTKKKTQPSRNYDHLAKNYTLSPINFPETHQPILFILVFTL